MLASHRLIARRYFLKTLLSSVDALKLCFPHSDPADSMIPISTPPDLVVLAIDSTARLIELLLSKAGLVRPILLGGELMSSIELTAEAVEAVHLRKGDMLSLTKAMHRALQSEAMSCPRRRIVKKYVGDEAHICRMERLFELTRPFAILQLKSIRVALEIDEAQAHTSATKSPAQHSTEGSTDAISQYSAVQLDPHIADHQRSGITSVVPLLQHPPSGRAHRSSRELAQAQSDSSKGHSGCHSEYSVSPPSQISGFAGQTTAASTSETINDSSMLGMDVSFLEPSFQNMKFNEDTEMSLLSALFPKTPTTAAMPKTPASMLRRTSVPAMPSPPFLAPGDWPDRQRRGSDAGMDQNAANHLVAQQDSHFTHSLTADSGTVSEEYLSGHDSAVQDIPNVGDLEASSLGGAALGGWMSAPSATFLTTATPFNDGAERAYFANSALPQQQFLQPFYYL